MALTTEQLHSLDSLLLSTESGANPLPRIRSGFPGMAVTRCDPDDMRGLSPFRRSGDYDVYLVDTSNHCWRIIDDPQTASGVVIAAHA